MDFSSARGRYVVLDATEINRDWFLSGPEFELLRFLISEAGIRAVVPASVRSESIANHNREYQRARKQLQKAQASVRRVAGGGIDLGPEIPEDRDYEARLAARLEILDINILALPETAHAEIVERSTQRRPPFDQTGSGYRDTLVWMSCLELAAAGETVFLVSQDKDFAGSDLSLAEPLAEEVAGLPGSITLVRHLGSWLLHLVPWDDVTTLKEALVVARDEVVATWFAPWDIFEAPDFTNAELGLPPNAEVHEVTYAGSGNRIIERMGETRLEDGSFRVVYTFPIEFAVEMTLPAEDARAEGYITTQEGNPSGTETISTSVPMAGQMTVIHDNAAEFPFFYESFDFQPLNGRPHDPASELVVGQLSIPLEADEPDGDDPPTG